MQILERKTEFATPWFKLLAKTVAGSETPFYSLELLDYVSIAAFTPTGDLALVRQFRPAVETLTLELPGGHVEKGEEPELAARRELSEESGLTAPNFELLGALTTDTGRHQNRLWAFLARDAAPVPGFQPENGVERILVPRAQIPVLLNNGEFNHSLHLAILMMVVAKHGAGMLGLR